VPSQRSTDHFELKPAQQRVLGILKSEGASRLTRARYEQLSGVSRSQAAYDLAELVENGVLERLGSGRATRYRVVHPTTSGKGGRRRWTHERIRAGLEDFCAGRRAWPSASEFKQAGRFDLYVAASRYGGIPFWTSELGLTREPQPPSPRSRRPRWLPRPRLQWVPAAAVAGLALAMAGGGHVRLSPGGAVLEAVPPQATNLPSLKPPTARQRVRYAEPARKTDRRAEHASRTRQTTPEQHASTTTASTNLASVQSHTPSTTASARTRTPTRTTYSTPNGSTSSGPAPLPAPSGGSSPRPLPPPGS
jgi:hypothetical protein